MGQFKTKQPRYYFSLTIYSLRVPEIICSIHGFQFIRHYDTSFGRKLEAAIYKWLKLITSKGEPFCCDTGDQITMIPTMLSPATHFRVYVVANKSKQQNSVILQPSQQRGLNQLRIILQNSNRISDAHTTYQSHKR